MQRDRLSLDFFLLFFGAVIFFCLFLGAHSLVAPDESRYIEITREMLASHDFVIPQLNGVPFLEKPILFYWLSLLSLKLGGFHEAVFRWVPAFFAVMGIFMVYGMGRCLYGRTTAWWCVGVLGTSPLYFGAAHYANMDLAFAVLLNGALFSYLFALVKPHRAFWGVTLGSVFVGLAILMKGFLGLLFPMMLWGLWKYYKRAETSIHIKHFLWSGLIIFAIIFPWMYLAQQRDPQFFHDFFWVHQYSRFLMGHFNNAMPPWFYIPILLVGFFPWVFWLFPAVRQQMRESPFNFFLLGWPLMIFIFFSVTASKIPGYILPLFPCLSLIIGHYMASHSNETWKRKMKCLMGIMAFLLLTMVAMIQTPSLKSFIPTVNAFEKENPLVVSYEHFYSELPLYLNHNIIVVTYWNDPTLWNKDNWRREFLAGMQERPSVNEWMWRENSFWKAWHGSSCLLVFFPKSYLPLFKYRAHSPVYLLKQEGRVTLVTNHPTQTLASSI